MTQLSQNYPLKFALIAVLASALFGFITLVLPTAISQRDSIFGYGSDSSAYWNVSTNLLKYHQLLNSPGDGFAFLAPVNQYTFTTQRLPGYPIFLAAARLLTGAFNPRSVGITLANLLLIFANTFFIISIFERDIIKGPFKFPQLYYFVAIFLPFLFYGNGINSDFFSATLLVGSLYFFLRPSKWGLLSPVLSGYAVWTRGNLIFFLIPFVILWPVFYRKDRRMLVKALVCLLIMTAVYAGWSYRNFKLSGVFTYTPFIGRQLQQNFIRKMVPLADPSGQDQYARWNSPEFSKSYFLQLAQQSNFYHAEAVIDRQITKDTASLLLKHPAEGLKTYVRDLAQMGINEYPLFNEIRMRPATWAIVGVLLLVFYVLPLLAFLYSLLWARRLFPYSIFAASALCYYLLTGAILGDFSRYALPVDFIFIYAIFLLTMKNINFENK